MAVFAFLSPLGGLAATFVLDHPLITIFFRYQSSAEVLDKTLDRVHYRCLSA